MKQLLQAICCLQAALTLALEHSKLLFCQSKSKERSLKQLSQFLQCLTHNLDPHECEKLTSAKDKAGGNVSWLKCLSTSPEDLSQEAKMSNGFRMSPLGQLNSVSKTLNVSSRKVVQNTRRFAECKLFNLFFSKEL